MKKNPLKIIFTIIVLILGVFIGNKLPQKQSDLSQQEVRKSFDYKFINPLLECNNNIANNNLSTLKHQVENIVKQQINNKNISFASIYFRDLNNGPWFGINEKEYFTPASLVKVPVLITYYKKAEKNPEILKQNITNQIETNGVSIQNIKPTETMAPDQNYTIEDLINRMIIYSDNDAYNDLTKNIDGNEILQTYKDLDIDISQIFTNPNGNILTVRDYASFFRILYNASYLNKDMSEKALNLLSQTEYKQGLVAGVPNKIQVAHKFGERIYKDTNEVQLHDCGIVYLPKKPYLLCIMTRSQDLNKATQTIKSISGEVFKYINSN